MSIHPQQEVEEAKDYWFPAKRYGWGWGLPSAWQGWLVLVAFMALLVAGTLLLRTEPPVFLLAYTAVLGVALVVICWRKGEPPRWRWGDK
ncbi:hypothetical protein [Paucibacter soli]|uniref:hypothetical protein n=1 Tax=Paucibacter soli TaxID=3133433 RepID=UPI0030B07498